MRVMGATMMQSTADGGRRLGRSRRRVWAAAVAAVLMVLAGPSAGLAAQPGSEAVPGSGVVVEPAVQKRIAAEGEADFWVVFDDTADLSGVEDVSGWKARGHAVYQELSTAAEHSQAGLAAQLTEQGARFESLWVVNAIYVRAGDQATLDTITAQDNVVQVRTPRTYRLPEPIQPEPVQPDTEGPSSATPQTSTGDAGVDAGVDAVEWGLSNIGADRVWSQYGVRGQDVVVGNIDTGVDYTHPALAGQYRGNNGGGTFSHDYSWWDPSKVCGSPSTAPCDNNGHGTHTMGTMVGDDGQGNQVGVAPQARWLAAKGCEASSCSEFALVSSGQFMLAPTDLAGANPRPELRPHIVNNSWGGPGGNDFYDDIVARWVAAGIFPVFSNGNAGPNCGTAGSPADGPDAYAVGAYDVTNTIARFSSRGAGRGEEVRPDIAAPGANVRSTFPGGRYASASGTSMAAPHVAGTVALMWSAAPELARDIAATRTALDSSAVDTEDLQCGGTAVNNNVWGEGRLDAFAAVQSAAIGPAPAVTITEPADPARATEGEPVTFTATATDYEDNDVSATLEWTSSADGPLGTGASITTALSWGTHTIIATARDSLGRSGSITLTVNVVAKIHLRAEGRRINGKHAVDLFWWGPRSRMVDIYRDNKLITTMEHSGYYHDFIGRRGNATYTYKVCEATTTICSEEVPVHF